MSGIHQTVSLGVDAGNINGTELPMAEVKLQLYEAAQPNLTHKVLVKVGLENV